MGDQMGSTEKRGGMGLAKQTKLYMDRHRYDGDRHDRNSERDHKIRDEVNCDRKERGLKR